jgi:heme exporter protein D
MMVDLGKYAGTVLSAYGVTLLLIFGLVALSLWQSRKVRRALEAFEKRMGRNG